MKETGKVFGVLQRVGRAFMLPIAVLPVAGLLLGIGRSLTNETMLRAYHLMKIMGPGTVLYGVIKVGSDCGSIIFGNLPLIFAMGVSIGMAKAEKAVAALSGALSFLLCTKLFHRCYHCMVIHIQCTREQRIRFLE